MKFKYLLAISIIALPVLTFAGTGSLGVSLVSLGAGCKAAQNMIESNELVHIPAQVSDVGEITSSATMATGFGLLGYSLVKKAYKKARQKELRNKTGYIATSKYTYAGLLSTAAAIAFGYDAYKKCTRENNN